MTKFRVSNHPDHVKDIEQRHNRNIYGCYLVLLKDSITKLTLYPKGGNGSNY